MGSVSWRARARPKQLLSYLPSDWLIAMYRTGRGWGKNTTAANNVNELIKQGRIHHGALVGPSAADVRDMMIDPEGKNSGLIPNSTSDFMPKYEPSKRQLVYPNGAVLTAYSAEDPDQLRGPTHDFGWLDELAAWKSGSRDAAWSNYQFSLRAGESKTIITTTPRPLHLLKNIEKIKGCYVVRGSTQENLHNLSQAYINTIIKPYEGTRLGLQELDGEILEENEAALFDMVTIERNRVGHNVANWIEYQAASLPDLSVVTVSVDPTGSKSGNGVGITVGGKGGDYGYLLDDRSLEHATPNQWARAVLNAADDWEADYIVVETNFGGDMVANTLKLVAKIEERFCPPIREVTASRGKVIRAEPVSMLTHQNRIKFVGTHTLLEDQLYELELEQTDDRADAFVWQFVDLLSSYIPRIRPHSGNAKELEPAYTARPAETIFGNIWNQQF